MCLTILKHGNTLKNKYYVSMDHVSILEYNFIKAYLIMSRFHI